MAMYQIPLDSLVFPLDGEDTLDVVTIIHPDETEMQYPRLWQTPDSVIDLNDVLLGLKDERGDARRHAMWIRDYYMEWGAFTGRIVEKMEAIIAAAKAGDQRQAKRLLADLTRAERAYIDEALQELRDEHPEWALTDVGDADVGDADEDSDHD